MAKKNNKQKKRRRSPTHNRHTGETRIKRYESRGSLAFTVAWVLTALIALVAVAVSLLLRGTAALAEETEGLPLLADLFLLVSLVAGILALLLTPIVYRIREIKPPRAIVLTVLGIGLLPAILLGMTKWLA